MKICLDIIHTLDDSIVVIDDLSKGGQAVGCAGGVADHLEALIVLLVVHAHHKHRSVGGWSRDDDLLCATLRVSHGLLGSGEDTGRFHDVLRSSAGPVDGGGVALVEDCDLVSVDVQELAVLLDFALELAVGGIVFEHVDHVVKRNERVVDSHNLKHENILYIFLYMILFENVTGFLFFVKIAYSMTMF